MLFPPERLVKTPPPEKSGETASASRSRAAETGTRRDRLQSFNMIEKHPRVNSLGRKRKTKEPRPETRGELKQGDRDRALEENHGNRDDYRTRALIRPFFRKAA